MVGSAPWVPKQFQTKGIDALLAAARQMSRLHLIFLWRGVLFEEMAARVRRLGLENQVEIINQKVDVNQLLARVHASVTLVTDPIIIRSYPHTLMESLAAGKPILVSRSIPMSDYVEQHRCGQVVEQVTPEDVIRSVEVLAETYTTFQEAAKRLDLQIFSRQGLLESFEHVYKTVIERTVSDKPRIA